MSQSIDTTFNVYSDTPKGKDPDTFSPSLRKFHRALWSKPLPNGRLFELSMDQPGCYLHHQGDKGDIVLSSDSIGHTYRYTKSTSSVIRQIPEDDLNQFFSICSTVGGYIIFPARKIDGKPTINASRGLNSRIKDRFDLTLECIRRHYLNQESPLAGTLARYQTFFSLFGSFNDYVDFFLLQDLVSPDKSSVNFHLPFRDFAGSPFPVSVDQYIDYKSNVISFVTARNARMARSVQ